MTPTPSNLSATRLHMARMRRRYAAKYRPLADPSTRPCCKGCGEGLWTFKDIGGPRCIGEECEFYMVIQ